MEANNLDPTNYIDNLYQEIVPPMPDLNLHSILTWQNNLRNTLVNLLGGFPKEKCALDPREDKPIHLDGYSRQKIQFTSRNGLDVTAYLLKSADYNPDNALIICVHGHGCGAYSVIGLEADGSPRIIQNPHRDFALQCVRRGYAALAIDQVCFGTRREHIAREKSLEHNSCSPIAGAALLLGQTAIGWRVYDIMRTIDYVETRDDLNPERIGIMGLSGGGTAALYTAALEPRIKASVISGAFCSFKESIMAMEHCICNYVPGILEHAEMWHIAGLIAPRGLFIETGTQDPIFPTNGVLYAYNKAKQIYEAFAAENMIGIEVFDGDHFFYGGACFDFLLQVL